MSKILFHTPDMEALASRVAGEADIRLGQIDWSEFHRGEPDLSLAFADARMAWDADAYVIMSVDMANIFPPYAALCAIAGYNARSLTVFMPFMPTAGNERVEEGRYGKCPTAMAFGSLFSSVRTHGSSCRITYVFWDLHAWTVQRFFHGVSTLNVTFMNRVRNHIARHERSSVVLFPDLGAKQRFGERFPGFRSLALGKSRNGDKRIFTIPEDARLEGEGVDIVDDLIRSGGTIEGAARLARERGARSVRVYLTHASFDNEAARERFVGNELFDEFGITDSIPGEADRLVEVLPFEVFSLDRDISRFIREGRPPADIL